MAYSQQQGLQKESANLALLGPASGSADFPTFRAITGLDIPFGGVNSQTTDYTALSGDSGKLISINGTSKTLTLPSSPPSAKWIIAVENLNSTSLTVSRNGLQIDGASSNVTLNQNQGMLIYTDGTNYFTMRGVGGSGTIVSVASTGNTTTQSGNLRANGVVLPAGLYRISLYMVVTSSPVAGTLSASIGWNDGTAARTATNGTNGMPADISTAATNFAQGSTVARADGTNDITYSITKS